ncbi:MAG: hypothetical protein AB7O79_01725 [Xanthobacteraceae bacterium]
MGRKLLGSLVAFALLAGACMPPVALAADPEDSGSALPDHLRKPLATFLAATGWKEGERLASSARHWLILDHVFLLRVVDAATCDAQQDLCLTIVGSLRNGGFVSEAVFFAGGMVRFYSDPRPLTTNDGPVLFRVSFIGRTQEVSIFPAPTGWIILPSPIAKKD